MEEATFEDEARLAEAHHEAEAHSVVVEVRLEAEVVEDTREDSRAEEAPPEVVVSAEVVAEDRATGRGF